VASLVNVPLLGVNVIFVFGKNDFKLQFINYSGDDCSIFTARAALPQAAEAVRFSLMAIFGNQQNRINNLQEAVIWLTAAIQLVWQIKIGKFRPNMRNWYLVVCVLWAAIRTVWLSTPQYNYTRLHDISLIVLYRWMDIVGQDLVTICMFLIAFAW
jgi:hypothetical protein